MTAAPQFAPVDTDTADLLALIADDARVEADYQRFLDACELSAKVNNGRVYVNVVRRLLTNDHGLTIQPQRLSAFWAKATGAGKPMVKLPGEWDICRGSDSGNDGRPQPVRKWIGGAA